MPAHRVTQLALGLACLALVGACHDAHEPVGAFDTAPDTSSPSPPDTTAAPDTADTTSDTETADIDVDTGPTDEDTFTTYDDTDGDAGPVDTGGGDAEVVYTDDPVTDCFAGSGEIELAFCPPCFTDEDPVVVGSIELVDCEGSPWRISRSSRQCQGLTLRDVPVGTWDVRLAFQDPEHEVVWEDIRVESDRTTRESPGVCPKCGSCPVLVAGTIAVLTGGDDHVETLLAGLGFAHDLWVGDVAADYADTARDGRTLLLDLERLLTYETMIVNGGDWGRWFDGTELDPVKLDEMLGNLEAFVMSGGSLVLTGDAGHWLERLSPAVIEFYGDPAAASPVDAAPGTWGVSHIGAYTVADIELVTDHVATALGHSHQIALQLDAGWPVALGAGPLTRVHLVAQQAPIYTEQTGLAELNAVSVMVELEPTQTSGHITWTAFHLGHNPVHAMESLVNFALFPL